MATREGEEREALPVVSGASSFSGLSIEGGEELKEETAKETARSVAWFALVHAAVALVVFLMLEEPKAAYECMEACPVLTNLEIFWALFFHIAHETMTVCSVVQMLAAALALASTGRLRQAASFVALFIAVATGTQSIRLVYTALFGSHCCFSGGIVQVATAVAVALGQVAIPSWGGWVAYDLAHAPLP